LKCAQQTLLSAEGYYTRPRKFKFLKKCAKLPLLSAEGCQTQLDGQHCPLRTYHDVFYMDGETHSHLFLMTKKGLKRRLSFMSYHEHKNHWVSLVSSHCLWCQHCESAVNRTKMLLAPQTERRQIRRTFFNVQKNFLGIY
jgi:hypothetical protein